MTLDQPLLRDARQARDRLLERQDEAERAQVAYQHAVRRLHAAGGSLREIAEALGQSYQRIHQIVDVGAGKGAVRPSRLAGPCSFCGAGGDDAAALIAGPRVFVCDRCVDLAAEVAAEAVARDHLVPVVAERVRCSFCGKRRRDADGMAARGDGGARICSACLALCAEVLAERR